MFRKVKPVYFLIILLSLVSQRIIYNEILYPDIETRVKISNAIIKGDEFPPFQYRILKPIAAFAISTVLSPVITNEIERYKFVFKIMLIAGFFFIYFVFYKFLLMFYSETTSIIGILILQVCIPLTMSNSNCFEEGDCITVFFYLLAFYAMFKDKDLWIPLIIAIGTLNREQSIFILIFYAAYLIDRKKIFQPRSIMIIAVSTIVFFAVFYGMRFYFGFKPNKFTNELHMQQNSEGWSSILRLWAEQVLVLAIIAAAAFRKSRVFFKLAILSLIPYMVFFFFFGVMGELGKFLPGLVILITMSLQVINKEYTGLHAIDVKHAA